MSEAGDLMHRKIGAFNALDAKETSAVFSPDREEQASGAGLHGGAGRVVRRSFSALDEANYLLDSVAEPWSVHLEVRLSGTVDEDRLRHAVGMALARFPRARARATISPRWRARYEWETTSVPQVDPLEVVVCVDDEALQSARSDLQSSSVPLVTSPPLRIRLARHRDGDAVMLNLHHAAGDGIAALDLLRCIACAYAGRPNPVPAVPPQEVEIPAPTGRWAQFRAVVGELCQVGRRAVHLVPTGGNERAGYGLYHLVLDAAQTAALSTHAAAGTTATVNDLLLAGLHMALDSWHAEYGGAAGRLSVLMPVNLRPKSNWYEGFGNVTFMVPVATRPEDRSDPTDIVTTIRRRTRRIKDERTPAAMVSLLDVLHYLPLPTKRNIARLVTGERMMPTAILSNLGRLDEGLHFGPGLRAREVWFSPPTRMPMGLAVGSVTAEGRLHLVFRYRHPLFAPAEVAAFADRYVSALGQIAAGARSLATRQD